MTSETPEISNRDFEIGFGKLQF